MSARVRESAFIETKAGREEASGGRSERKSTVRKQVLSALSFKIQIFAILPQSYLKI